MTLKEAARQVQQGKIRQFKLELRVQGEMALKLYGKIKKIANKPWTPAKGKAIGELLLDLIDESGPKGRSVEHVGIWWETGAGWKPDPDLTASDMLRLGGYKTVVINESSFPCFSPFHSGISSPIKNIKGGGGRKEVQR